MTPTTGAATTVLDTLAGRGESLATAESVTGGMLAAMLTDVPGASRAYRGGVVSYATALKTSLLGVPQAVVDDHGVISAPCAAAMADGVRRVTGATYAVSTTGVAGPDEQEDQPVGTVFVGVSAPTGTVVTSLRLSGDREAIRRATCAAALDALVGIVAAEHPDLG